MDLLVQVKSNANEPLGQEERNMLSVAYKNAVGTRRSSWRQLNASEAERPSDAPVLKEYVSVIESELEAKCNRVIQLVQKYLLDREKTYTANDDVEVPVFYLKMCGDYYRYMAEWKQDAEYKTNAKEQYSAALNLAKEHLEPTHPTRLGLALNASVRFYEILEQKDEACKLAKEAFDAAIQKLDSLHDSNYKDSTLIMQLLRDNLTLWNNNNTEDDGEEA